MSQIKVSLYDQTAVFTETPDIFSGDIDVDTVKFTFDSSWNVYNKKTAIFYNDPKKSYPIFLDDTNTAVIPSAVIDRRTKLYFGVIGTNANSEVKTSSILSYRIERGAISADVEIPPSSAEIWLQILLNYEIALKKLQDMSSNLENMNNTLEELDQRFLDANVENKANKDFSNVTNTDFSNKCKSVGIPVINKIPVDLTGIYNKQMIGYDEEQGKLVPMSAVAKTQTVIPSTETPRIWELTESSSQVVSEDYPYPRYIFRAAGTATITFKHPFMLSEFNTIKATVAREGSYHSYKIIFSKNPDFSTIDAQYIISNSNNGTLNIANLYGKYYMRFVYTNTYNGTSTLWVENFTMS